MNYDETFAAIEEMPGPQIIFDGVTRSEFLRLTELQQKKLMRGESLSEINCFAEC